MTNRMASLATPDDRKSSTFILLHTSLRDSGVYYCIVGVAYWDSSGCTVQYLPGGGKDAEAAI
jgi:hypothetical protein